MSPLCLKLLLAGLLAVAGKFSGSPMGKGLRTALMGAFAGLLAAVALAKVLASLLFGVHRFDGMVDAGVVLIVFVIALLASYLPARRAMRIHPSGRCANSDLLRACFRTTRPAAY